MNKIFVAVAGAAGLSLGACASTDPTTNRVATGAGVWAAGGAALGAGVGGLNPIEGAVLGAAVGGLAGAVPLLLDGGAVQLAEGLFVVQQPRRQEVELRPQLAEVVL